MEREDNGLVIGVMVGHECTGYAIGSVNSRVEYAEWCT